MELVFPSRGSRQLSSRLPSEDREVLPLIDPPFFSHDKSRIRGALRTGCRSIAVYADAGSFGSPELGVRAGGGQILHLSLGSHLDLGSLRPRGRDESIKTACGWTPWASSGERSAKGNPRELFRVRSLPRALRSRNQLPGGSWAATDPLSSASKAGSLGTSPRTVPTSDAVPFVG